MHTYDMAVVGAGPIGIEIAVALKQHGIDYVHFDAKQIAYTISWYAPQTRFFSSNERIAIAGVPFHTVEQSKATREQYLNYLRSVVEQFDLQIHTYEPVTDVQREHGHFVVTTHPAGGERQHHARRVVLCTGGTDRPRLLNIPGETLPHVSHYFDDPHKYFRRRVLVVGSKNSAVEAALRCHIAGAHVTMCYRSAGFPESSIKYWLLPELRSLTESGRIKTYAHATPAHISPTHVTLKLGAETSVDVQADFVLLMTGYEQDNTLLKRAGVELVGPSSVPEFNPATLMTNVPGVYVAGTCVGGTQGKFSVFIENCHDHAAKIIGHAFGIEVSRHALALGLAES